MACHSGERTTTKGIIMTDNIHTHLDELIAEERRKANARIAKLRKQAEAEQRRVDAEVIVLLRNQMPDVYERLTAEAADALAAEKAQRSSRAKKATTSSAVDAGEAVTSWNG